MTQLDNPNEDPTAKGDRVAALMRAYYEANRPRWWQRRFSGDHADELMLGLVQIVLWEYRHEWPPTVQGTSTMTLFRHRRQDDHDQHNPWRGAPDWARELGEMQAISIAQGEAALAKLEERPCKLSPEDQAIMNEIFDRATATKAKVDAAEKA